MQWLVQQLSDLTTSTVQHRKYYSLHITNLTVGVQLREIFGVTDFKQGRSANCNFHETIEGDNKVCRNCVTNDNVHTGCQNMA